MPRRRVAAKRALQPDPVHKNTLITKLINHIMVDGKRSCAQNIVYNALQKLASRVKSDNPVELLERALGNLKPPVEVKSRRVGGATYQIPVEVQSTRAITLAIRWLIQAARKRAEKGMISRLAAELQDILERTEATP